MSIFHYYLTNPVQMKCFTFNLVVFIICVCLISGVPAYRKTTLSCKKGQEGIPLEKAKYKISHEESAMAVCNINFCPLPKISFVDFFNKIGINVASLKLLTLNRIPHLHSVRLNADLFKGLSITYLLILYDDVKILSRPMPDFLDPLTDLRTLVVNGVEMPPLPESSVITSISFSNGASTGKFGGCDELTDVNLRQWDVNEDRWLESCTELTSLTIQYMTVASVYHIVRDAQYLEYLEIHHCNLAFIPEHFFDNMLNLETLDLSINQLDVILLEAPLPSLQRLDLSYNVLLRSYRVAWLLRQLPVLEILNLSSDEFSDFDLCDRNIREDPGFNLTSLSIEHNRLEVLQLSNTNTTRLCIERGALPALKLLELDGNFKHTSEIIFQSLLVSKQPLMVNFLGDAVKNIIFTKEDYEYFKTESNTSLITLAGILSLDCDCNHAFFAEAIKENLVIATLAHCYNNDTHISLVPQEVLKCDRFTCGHSSNSTLGCDCRRKWKDNATTADCRGRDVDEIPNVPHLSRVIAPHNHIQVIRKQDLPDTLLFLDLTDNGISHVDEEQSRILFSIPERRMNLFGNPIVCDCENSVLIDNIQQHFNQVEDYYNLTCAGGDILLREVVPSKLCLKFSTGVVTASSIAGALITFAALVGTLYYRFRKMIRIYLYARGWCLCCIKEDGLDADRPYDAFVSFCHVDESLVSEQLVPQLDERGYKICVHYRDWVPGELIPVQIVRSVEASRRTIVVLSRSFLESMWGLLEFRIAHVRALKDGIARIILIVIDDVVDEDTLDGDLRSYIRTNTYVRWDDPWFWDKLKYAMPHGQQPKQVKEEDVIC